MADISFKIVIVGEARVGKTSIIQKYVKNTFNENESESKDFSHSSKLLNYKGVQQELNIWVYSLGYCWARNVSCNFKHIL